MRKIRNLDRLADHGDVESRRLVLTIAERTLERLDAYNRIKSIMRFDGRILTVGTRQWDLDAKRNVYLVGAGKACNAMARAVDEVLGDRLTRGIAIVKVSEETDVFNRTEVYVGGHPLPNDEGHRVAHNVKPVIGCEVYVAPRSRKDRTTAVVSDDYERGGNYHLILLAMNNDGYRNLSRMVSQSYIDGFYYKPRIDKELLREFNEGILCLSGCLGSEVATAITADRYDVARRVIEEYVSIFGDRYYLEIQDNHLEQQAKVNRFLREISPEVSIPIVATNDCHYLEPEDHEAHEVLLCVQTGKRLADENRWRFETDQLFVKDAENMLSAFSDCPDAIRTSLEIADRCNVELTFGKNQFPVYEVPEGRILEDYLRDRCREGLEERLTALLAQNSDLDVETYRARLESEIETIISTGSAGYFLVVADFVNYAKDRGIPVGPGRHAQLPCESPRAFCD